MKLKFTRKTWYFLLLASAAASMLNGFAVLSGTSFSLIEQIAFAAAGIAVVRACTLVLLRTGQFG